MIGNLQLWRHCTFCVDKLTQSLSSDNWNEILNRPTRVFNAGHIGVLKCTCFWQVAVRPIRGKQCGHVVLAFIVVHWASVQHADLFEYSRPFVTRLNLWNYYQNMCAPRIFQATLLVLPNTWPNYPNKRLIMFVACIHSTTGLVLTSTILDLSLNHWVCFNEYRPRTFILDNLGSKCYGQYHVDATMAKY